ncbi:MAG TPA: CPBP family intramembrane glutamic endopeptidase [Gemmatimonadaceae bacterium]
MSDPATSLLLAVWSCPSISFLNDASLRRGCEEWIYRGFLLHLFTVLPGANGWLIVLATAVLFGVAHTYQGRSGGVLTGLLGFVFALLLHR